MSFRLFRELERGEFIIAFEDTAQGGTDKNFIQFLSKTKADFPLVYSAHGVAAATTPHLRQALEYVHKQTGVKPVIAVERQNGGASVMHDLIETNNEDHYTIYFTKKEDGSSSDKPGWDTNTATRPKMLGEWLTAFNAKLVTIYDQETLEHHQTFIVNNKGKPEAAPSTHDDGVMSCAGAWQLYQTEQPPMDESVEYNTGEFATAWL